MLAALVGVTVLICIWLFRKFILGIEWPLLVLISLIIIWIVLLILFILLGYTAQWTGFRRYDKETKEYKPDGQLDKITKEHQPEKTFWDWLQLLVIPFVLAGATLGFGWWQANLAQQQHVNDQNLAQDQQRAEILQTYLDNMQDLLIHNNLQKSHLGDEVVLLARERTLIALQRLDSQRKGVLVQFLYDSNLIGYSDPFGQNIHPPIIILFGADLTRANLTNAHLSGADLFEVNLSSAHLASADLSGAYLEDADLSGTDLSGADLSDAYLRGTNITQQQLDQVYSCQGATLPNGLTCYKRSS